MLWFSGVYFPCQAGAEEKEDDGHADDHVQSVGRGHPEVEREEDPGVSPPGPVKTKVGARHEVLYPLVVVFVRLRTRRSSRGRAVPRSSRRSASAGDLAERTARAMVSGS